MNPTTRNIWIVVGVIVIAVVVSLVFKGGSSLTPSVNEYQNSSTSPSSTTTGTEGTGSSGTASNHSGTTGGGTVAGVVDPLTNSIQLMQIASNSLIRIPQTGVDVALTKGTATSVVGNFKSTVTLGALLANIPTDSGHDLYVDMTLEKGGAPEVLHYVALFHATTNGVTYTSAVAVADRVKIVNVVASADSRYMIPGQPTGPIMNTYKGYVVTINYLDRKSGEPFTTAPSVPKTLNVYSKGHMVTK